MGYKVKGILVGNGWTTPRIPYSRYPDFALDWAKYTKFTQEDYEKFKPLADLCTHLLEFGSQPFTMKKSQICWMKLMYGIAFQSQQRNPNFNMYNMDYKPPSDQTKPHKNDLMTFLKYYKNQFPDPIQIFITRPQIQAELGNPGTEYKSLSADAFRAAFEADFHSDAKYDVEGLLEKGVKVYLFYGDLDFLCNFESGENTMQNFVWRGSNKWNQIELEKCGLGLCKEFLNLKYARLEGAGHFSWITNKTEVRGMVDELVKWNV
jgi:cathepsin A (carboxypeptidase C)